MPKHISLEGGLGLEIISFDTLDSTQKYLVDAIEQKSLIAPIAVVADFQTEGVGSRGNTWSAKRGNLFVSFALPCSFLPEDLPLVSASLYFGYIMKETLRKSHGGVWIKWPNDLYVGSDKIGGVITQKIDNNVICGIGVNLYPTQDGYSGLSVSIVPSKILGDFFLKLEKLPSWKQIFRNYKIEFDKNRDFFVHIGNYQKSLSSAVLCEDGSIILDGEKVYGLR